MPLIKKFEDIMAWQEARKLVQRVYQLTRTGALSKDFGLRDQLQRASVSVMSNIAEGFDCPPFRSRNPVIALCSTRHRLY